MREQRQARWLSVPIPQKELIKNNVTATLGAAGELARRAAVQVIAKLGYLEITPADNKWPTLLPGLISFAVNEAYPAEARSSALTALSFLLEELDAYDESPLHQSTVDSILTAICQNMALAAARALQVAATRAMLTALPFVATNFDDAGRVNERNAIMMAMCTSTTSDTADVKHTAFLCIEKTAELYYEHLGPYMKVLADLTAAGARSTDEAVAVTALGFWSEIASWEVEHPEKSQKYVKGALAPLISMVTEIMSTSVEELDDDVDADVVAEAAQAALQSFACVVQDDIVQPIMDFMNANFNNPDFKKRDAAVMAFGCILEGPNAEVLRTRYIGTILPYLIDRIQGGRARDPSARVRQSIGFALAEIFGNHFEVVDLEKHFIPLMQALCAALDDSPGVATQILRAIDNMVTSGQSSDGWLIASPSGGEANALSPLLFESIKAIIMRGDRPDASEGLRTSCYEAISTMVENASPADSVVLLNLMQNAVQRIVASLAKYQAATSKEEREGELVMQDALVGLVTSVCLCVGEEALPQGDAIMSAMLHCIGARTSPSEAWRAIGALSSGMKPATDGDTSPAGSASAAHVNILRYIEPMWPMLIATLSNPAEVSPCYTALLATSSIVTALGGLVEQRASELLAAVLRILSDEAVDRDLKPPALVILGDVSLRLGASISVYLPNMHALILGASQVAVDKVRAQPRARPRLPRAPRASNAFLLTAPPPAISLSSPPLPVPLPPRRTGRATRTTCSTWRRSETRAWRRGRALLRASARMGRTTPAPRR